MNWEAAIVVTVAAVIVLLMALTAVLALRAEDHRRQWFQVHECRRTGYLPDLAGPVALYTCDDGEPRTWHDIPGRTR